VILGGHTSRRWLRSRSISPGAVPRLRSGCRPIDERKRVGDKELTPENVVVASSDDSAGDEALTTPRPLDSQRQLKLVEAARSARRQLERGPRDRHAVRPPVIGGRLSPPTTRPRRGS